MSKFLQGRFTPTNPSKYVGNVSNIVYRSSWELKLFIWCDTNPSVLNWNSEEVVIPYICPTDNKPHRYFVDVAIKYKDSQGNIKKALLEVKPNKQTLPPKPPKRQTKRYIQEVFTYAKNTAKWQAANNWCKQNGFEFKIIDEYMLGLKARPK